MRHHSLCCAALALTSALLASPAIALSPATSTRVSSVTFESSYGTVSPSASNTLLIDIEQCKLAVQNDGDIRVRYTTTNFDPSSTLMTAGIYYYQGVYYFEQGRDQGSSPSCFSSGCNQVEMNSVTRATTSVLAEVPFRTLTTLTSAQACETASTEQDHFIRLQIYDGTNGDQADAKILVDLVRPAPPEDFDAVVTEGSVALSWTAGASGDVAGYRLVYKTSEFEGGVLPDEVEGAQQGFASDSSTLESDAIIADQTPGQTIWLAVATVDDAGNESALIGPKPFTVIDTVDFWEYYKGRGGDEEGGYCAHADTSGRSPLDGSLLATFGLLLGAGLARRRRRHLHATSSHLALTAPEDHP